MGGGCPGSRGLSGCCLPPASHARPSGLAWASFQRADNPQALAQGPPPPATGGLADRTGTAPSTLNGEPTAIFVSRRTRSLGSRGPSKNLCRALGSVSAWPVGLGVLPAGPRTTWVSWLPPGCPVRTPLLLSSQLCTSWVWKGLQGLPPRPPLVLPLWLLACPPQPRLPAGVSRCPRGPSAARGRIWTVKVQLRPTGRRCLRCSGKRLPHAPAGTGCQAMAPQQAPEGTLMRWRGWQGGGEPPRWSPGLACPGSAST